MKITISALAIAVALVPSFAAAGPFSDAIGMGSSGIDLSGSVSDAIGEAVNEPHIDLSHPANDGIIDAVLGGNAGPNTGRVHVDAKVKVGAVLKCIVLGTPSEFPDDLRIKNAGVAALPAGTDIKWKVAGDIGYVTLDRALSPGSTLRLNGVLEGGVEAGTACSAKVQ